MYSAEFLLSYPFFSEMLKQADISTMLDSLTGVVSRAYIIRFIRFLIESKTPFALGMMDLDNFKSVNDNYGHRAGDGVLSEIAGSLSDFLGSDGLVGRFGGDEFLIVYLKSNTYDDVHDFYDGVYDSGKVLRRILHIRDLDIFMTATVGCASYPTDGEDFDALFAKIDKTLYRGKSKGRNCYIIYVPAKHANLEITTLAKHSLYETLRLASQNFDESRGVNVRMQRAFAPIAENLRLNKLLYINGAGQLKDALSQVVLSEHTRVSEYLNGRDMVSFTHLEDVKDELPDFFAALDALNYNAALISRISREGVTFGYLVVCPEQRTMRMWQDDEFAAIFFLCRLVATHLTSERKPLV